MSSCLKRYWDVQTLWPICLGILFGTDVADIDFSRRFDVPNLMEMFGKRKVVFPEALQLITSMLHHGFKDVVRFQEHPDSPVARQSSAPHEDKMSAVLDPVKRARSMSLNEVIQCRCKCLLKTCI